MNLPFNAVFCILYSVLSFLFVYVININIIYVSMYSSVGSLISLQNINGTNPYGKGDMNYNQCVSILLCTVWMKTIKWTIESIVCSKINKWLQIHIYIVFISAIYD